MRKTLTWLALAAAVAYLTYLALREEQTLIASATASPHDLQQTYNEEGRTRLKNRYHIHAPVSGTLRRITLQAGDNVRAGQTLAEIEPASANPLDARSHEQAEADLRGAEAALEAARQHIAAAKSAHTLAQKEHQRLVPLVKAQAASREQLDQARAQRDSTSANLAAAQAEEKIAAARVQSARALLASHNEAGAAAVAVTAPIAGVITKRQHQSRTPIAAGELLMEMGDPAQLEIEADILSADAVRLAPGTRARIRHWGGDDLDASVRRIEPGGFTKTSALGVEEQRTRVILDLTSPHAQWQTLGDAYRVDIEFILAEKNGALTIPLSALYRDGDGWCGGAFIYALFSREKNGAKFCQGARNGAGCGGVKVCGVVQLGAARNCAVCAVLLQIYLHCLRFKCARLIAFEAGFIPAFLWALFGEVVGDVDDLAADLDVVML